MNASIPATMPTEFVDRTVYLGAEAGIYGLELGGVVSFEGRLDEPRLRRTMRLLLDAEPVLGCRFDTETVPPVWRRLDGLDSAPLLEARDSADPAGDAAAFIAEPFDRQVDPQVRALLLRTASSDVLAVRLGHLAVDGGAGKEALYLIGEIYRRLAERPDWTPDPNVDGVRAPVVRAGLLEKLRSLGPGDLKTPPSDPDLYLPLSGRRGPASYVCAHVEPDVFGTAIRLAKASGATANDVILTAHYRNLWRLIQAKPGARTPQMLTCELRKHMPPGTKTALANISSAWWISVSPAPNEAFDGTLARVSAATQEWKRGGAGKGSAIGIGIIHKLMSRRGLEGMRKMMFAKSGMDPTRGGVVLTNIGVVDAERLDFGGSVPVVDACLLAPATPMGAGLAASTYRDRLHLTAGVEFAAIGEEMANAVVAGTAREIEDWVGPRAVRAVDRVRTPVAAASNAE